jgi:hypothetical protein
MRAALAGPVGAAASLPAQMITARREHILVGLARRRVQVDRHRHRDRKTKGRRACRPAGRTWPPAPRQPRSPSAA